MQVNGNSKIGEIVEGKDEEAQHLLHKNLCKIGDHKFCGAFNITLYEAAQMTGENLDSLIKDLNEVPDKKIPALTA